MKTIALLTAMTALTLTGLWIPALGLIPVYMIFCQLSNAEQSGQHEPRLRTTH